MLPIRFGLFYLLLVLPAAASSASDAQVSARVLDDNDVPVPSAEVTLTSPSGELTTIYTNSAGEFELKGLQPGRHTLSVSKPGYFRISSEPMELHEGLNQVSLTLHHETEIHTQVEVSSTSSPMDTEEPAHKEVLVAREIRDIPVPNSHDLQSSLPILPAVVRDNTGQIHVAGGRVGETQLFLDGFEIGDPITGALNARVNVDAVRDVEVDAGRYGVQYGGGGAGVLTLDTAVGDDKFRASTTNFIPGITNQQGLHLGNWFPRFEFSGPLRKGRAWFSEALSLQHSFMLVKELPRDANTSTQWAGDNLLRAQINLTPRNVLQGSFLYNRQINSHIGLGPFTPLSTTTDLRSQRSFVSVKDQAWTRRVLFDFGTAFDFGHRDNLPMGPGPYIVQPSATAGNYFETLRQQARRSQVTGGVTLPDRQWHGAHNLQAGVHVERITWAQTAVRSPIDVERQDGSLLQQTAFAGPSSFRLSDTLTGIYAQDSWTVSRPLNIQAGVRGDWDSFLQHAMASPRISANIVPWVDERAKLAVASGVFYQPVRLNNIAPAFDQFRQDTYYGPSGTTVASGPVTSLFTLPQGGLKLPRFHTTSVEWQEKIRHHFYAGVNLVFREERNGLAYETRPSTPGTTSFLLQNNRRDSYRAAQFSLRRTFGDKAEISATYTRSSARSSEALDYMLSTLVFSPQQAGPLEWDAPNRLVSSGWAPAPIWGLFLSYFFEYRTGFPFGVVNQQQQLVGAPGSLRFPDYVCLNLGIEKHIRLLRRVWAVRLAVINAGGNANPNSVINNTASPNFLQFAGGQGRAFTARLRLVG